MVHGTIWPTVSSSAGLASALLPEEPMAVLSPSSLSLSSDESAPSAAWMSDMSENVTLRGHWWISAAEGKARSGQ